MSLITRSYLEQYLGHHPERRSQLLLSNQMDQIYQHQILIRSGIKPSIDEINKMLDQLQTQGIMQQLFSTQVKPSPNHRMPKEMRQ